MSKQNKEFFEAVNMMEKERGIPAEFLFDRIKTAVLTQVKKLNDLNNKNL